MVSRNDLCWCHSGKKWKKCHYPIGPVHNAQDLAREYKKKFGILLKTPRRDKRD
ncbi:MAG: SEC-C domain-containing protein [Rhabdochlamydiaceae bacterium]